MTANAAYRIMDHETWPEKNEVCKGEFKPRTRSIEVGSTQRPSFWIKCGGEIRVEFHYALTQRPDGLIAVTEGLVELYEGATTNTDELGGSSAFEHKLIWPGQSVSWQIHVQNWRDGEPDDKADVTFTVRNW
ncbi:hypothetical protein [Nocardia goodfellowii]|uniref:Uncharacterized protein n=1 Tax=Nocardia goodfellowii TaxID=882446 RepID=A0ABS4QN99_9NOCA|nr:hypothetical protein [Nocardia goodfellowii]MBP2193018.1 hypothetical protein [Nocardia goodfellowii]